MDQSLNGKASETAAQPSWSGLDAWPIILTKLLRPRLPVDHVPHEALERRYLEARSPTHWCISCSAGYGKTTLASSFCERFPGTVGWLSLDVDDDVPERFALYLAAAFITACPAAGERFTPFVASSQRITPRQLVTLILNEAFLRQHPVALVLDDYQFIENADIHAAVALLLTRASPNLQIMVLSRVPPPLPLSALQLRKRVCCLSNDDLAFDRAMARSFLRLQHPAAFESAEPLLDMVGGWAAGLRSIGLLEDRPATEALSGADLMSHGTIGDFLWEQVLSRLPPASRAFLLRTSILDAFDADVSEAVTRDPASGERIAEIARRQLFVLALDDRGRWYRYHPLFQAYLQQELRRREPDAIPDLQRRAAGYWSAHGLIAKALRHALEAGAADLVIDVLNRPDEALVNQGEGLLLERALNALTPEQIASHPRISRLAGRYWMARDRSKVLPLLERASRRLPAGETGRYWRAVFDVLRAQVAFGLEDIALGVALASEALAALPEDDARTRSEAHQLLAEAYHKRGELQPAHEQWRLSERLACEAGLPQLRVWSKHQLAMIDLIRGDVAQALAGQEATIAYGERHCIPSAHSLWCVLRGRAEIAWEQFELDVAEWHCQKALGVCRYWKNDGTVPIHIIRARLQLLLGHKDEAHRHLEEARAILNVEHYHGYVTSYFDLAKTEYAMRYGTASDLAALSLALPDPGPYTDEISLRRGRIRVLHRIGQGEYAAAAALAQELVDAAASRQLELEAWRARLSLAICLERLDRGGQAIDLFHQCMRFAAPRGLLGSLLIIAPLMDALLARYLAAGLGSAAELHHAQRVRDLLAHSRARPHRKRPVPAPLRMLAVTPLDWRVLECVLNGDSNEDIALAQHMALGTVKNTLTRIYRKLNVRNRSAAVSVARKLLQSDACSGMDA